MKSFYWTPLLFVLCIINFQIVAIQKKVAIIGTGYVGLICGSGLADMGHKVICADIDVEKISKLQNGIMPIYEPGLQEIVLRNIKADRLAFTSNVADTVKKSEIIIIAVGTPMSDTGDANLSALKSVAHVIAQNLNGYKIVCTKSTVPVGTNKLVKSFIKAYVGGTIEFDVVSNPEFLRAGSAIKDFFECNPIVLGSDSDKALNAMKELYQNLIKKGLDLITTNLETAEMIKYSWNSFSAIRIAYVNELSRFCCSCGADVFTVVKGMSLSDKLLPSYKIKPGPGIGGSCLPKDTRAFVAMAKKQGVDLCLVNAYIESNKKQKQFAIDNVYKLLDYDISGKVIGVLGLSFKKNTDDIRMSPAIHVIKELLKAGAHVKAYDPQAMNVMRNIFSDTDVQYCKSCQEVAKDADALIILTEWDEFKNMDLEFIAKFMKNPVLVDGRNLFSPTDLEDLGFKYYNLGRVN